uniref:Uncharacterized protein n=1 Tax=Peronospora matthiolae TaxID=2874970 RepID=A0AAV1V8Y1_9STRA
MEYAESTPRAKILSETVNDAEGPTTTRSVGQNGNDGATAGKETLAGMKRKRKQELKAEREKKTRLDLDQCETLATFRKRRKRDKDRLGLTKVPRKKSHLRKPKRSGGFVIEALKQPAQLNFFWYQAGAAH